MLTGIKLDDIPTDNLLEALGLRSDKENETRDQIFCFIFSVYLLVIKSRHVTQLMTWHLWFQPAYFCLIKSIGTGSSQVFLVSQVCHVRLIA